MKPRVLFVSKPVVPPWNDGSKNLVRDLVNHVSRVEPMVMTLGDRVDLADHVQAEGVYVRGGGFAPAILDNARVVGRLLRGDAGDLWHFVFAPNPASSYAARAAIAARRLGGFRGKVVQSVASAPKRFEGVPRLIFGDVVVTLSEATKERLLAAGVTTPITVIPPCAIPLPEPSAEAVLAFRQKHGLGDAPVVLYPGDYEVSSGARTVVSAVPELTRRGFRVVLACRQKTPRAAEVRRALEAEEPRAVHLGEVPDMATLLAAADVVAFPVDDLYGKVDLPLVLLEALAFGKPVVVAEGTPLTEIPGAAAVPAKDPEALVAAISRAYGARSKGDALRELHRTHFMPEVMAARYEDLYASLLPPRAL